MGGDDSDVVSQRVLVLGRLGFTVIELLIVLAIMSVVMAASVPWMITYSRSATLKAGAEEMAAGLNRARQLAISQNQNVCVEVTAAKYRFHVGSCGAAVWTGMGTGTNGFFTLSNRVTVASNANPVFDYLGAANPGATLSVTNPEGGATLSVVVSPAGRVRVCPAAGCV
jgi:type II secretion system protein H